MTVEPLPSKARWLGSPTAGTLAVFAAALALLFAELWGMTGLVGNFSKYPVAALNLLNGELPPERFWDFSPLFLWLTVTAARLFAQPLPVLLGLQFTLTALAAALLHAFLRRRFGPLPALLGAAAFLLNPSLLIYAGILEPEPLMLCTLAAALCFSDVRKPWGALATGSALALCLMTRPGFLPLALLTPVAYALDSTGSQRRRLVGFYFLPFLVPLLLLAARGGPFPPPVMSPGSVFYEGNGPLATGTGVAYPPLFATLAGDLSTESDYNHAVYRLTARKSAGEELTQGQTNRFWVGKALAYVADHPVDYLALELKKAWFLFHSHRWHDLNVAYRVDRELEGRALPRFPLAAVTGLAVAGLFLAARKWREFFVPYAGFANQAGLILLTYASDRQRLSLLPFLVVFAAIAVKTAWEEKARARWIAGAALALMLAFSVSVPVTDDNDRVMAAILRSSELQDAATRLAQGGDLAAAAELSAQSVALTPVVWLDGRQPTRWPFDAGGLLAKALNYAPTDKEGPLEAFNRALLLGETGDTPQADAILAVQENRGARPYRTPFRFPPLSFHRGRLALRRGDRIAAAEHLERALREDPGNPSVLAWRAVLTGAPEDENRLRRYFDEGDALLALGQAALEAGDAPRAVEAFSRLTTLLPEYRDGWMCLAAALGEVGRPEEASRAFSNAMSLRDDTVMLGRHLLPAFAAWAMASPPDGYPRYFYGKVLHQYGQFAAARQALRDCLAASGRPEVAAELEQVERNMRLAGLLPAL